MITERLKKAAELIGETEILADIGCDHGHLPAELLLAKKVQYAIAGDISKPSLLKAEK